MELSEEEQTAIDEYNLAHEAYFVADEKLDKIFRLRYESLLAAGKIEEVKDIIRVMPDCLARIYAADAMRVARGDYDK